MSDAKATCTFCNKVISVKALRYSHAKVCKKQQPVPVERRLTMRLEEPSTPRNSIVKHEETNFMNLGMRPPHEAMTHAIQPKARPTKAELRQPRLNNVVSQAV